MSDPQTTDQEPTEREVLAEGYPTLTEVLTAIPDAEDVEDVGVQHLEIHAFASGDATFRIWYVGVEEAVGGYLDNL